ncbi:Malic acid transport protein [Fulvia fulva]|uniref:Malic acid transport protein n=1 Tax=Passalora fulva TaxID=5499 RepID=A0A9Q8PG48_PASFU|nr:Malic acid transport protein [Fulvia fulva]KAK4613393.1 Malic acid transport protein [Fulvia fulva]KAK4615075.1 Malic acid transport protein [Fulvia fulva]UJO21800.1 Malic acid transport protein [Fulvia fulva]WPV20543.1 Malic acid transport protein [Fulvia fulva]WPV35422.1 Malic acid transport protein [Fulvia fulva]
MSQDSSNSAIKNGQPNDSKLENANSNGTPKPQHPDEPTKYRLPFTLWLADHFTWSWFTCTQSTGGVATLLSECPKQFHGLYTIGVIIFIFNIILWIAFTSLMALRWYANPSTIKRCFTQPPECFFFGSFWLSVATMVINMQRYGVPHSGAWLVGAVRVLFWIYAACSISVTMVHIVVISKYTPFSAIAFAPPMFILILNAMLTGTVAAAIVESQPEHHRLSIMVAGVGYQGLGWIVCTMFLTLTMANLLEKGWPAPNVRSGLFIMVGTSGFTIVALIGIARGAPEGYAYFAAHPMAKEILVVVATWVGVFMWVFSFWVFGLALLVNLVELMKRDEEGKWRVNVQFTNTSWASIFPNVGWTLSTIYLGQEFESEGIIWVSVAMTILLVAFWLLELFLMMRAVARSIFVDARIKMA